MVILPMIKECFSFLIYGKKLLIIYIIDWMLFIRYAVVIDQIHMLTVCKVYFMWYMLGKKGLGYELSTFAEKSNT